MADSKYKRGFNNSVNVTHFKKENTYRYMSVTPSHKYHETKKTHDFRYPKVSQREGNTLSKDPKKPKLAVNNLTEPPKYKRATIEEVKDEYNDSKLSFNNTDDVKQKELDLDIEAMIIVEDKICSLSNNIANEYYEVTREVYKRVNEQFEIIAGELKHIKTIKSTLILEYIVVIMISMFSNDPKMHKATQLQFKNLNYYVHQNILLFIDVIIDRLPN